MSNDPTCVARWLEIGSIYTAEEKMNRLTRKDVKEKKYLLFVDVHGT